MAGENILVLDLETQKSFKDTGKANLHKLKVSVAGVYDYREDAYEVYEEKDILSLDKRLQEVDFVIGFNIRGFDFPVLEPYLFRPVDQIPMLDLLDDVARERGHRVSLDSIAAPTLKQHKTGHGSEAITMFEENRMEELKSYCLEDVRITKEVYEYGCREGKVFFTSNRDYKTYEIPVSWQKETRKFLEKSEKPQEDPFPTSLF